MVFKEVMIGLLATFALILATVAVSVALNRSGYEDRGVATAEPVRYQPIAKSFNVRCPYCNSLVHVVTPDSDRIGEIGAATKPTE